MTLNATERSSKRKAEKSCFYLIEESPGDGAIAISAASLGLKPIRVLRSELKLRK